MSEQLLTETDRTTEKRSALADAIEMARQNRCGAGDPVEAIQWANAFNKFRRHGMDLSDAAYRADEAVKRSESR
jgi:hypothetical protein